MPPWLGRLGVHQCARSQGWPRPSLPCRAPVGYEPLPVEAALPACTGPGLSNGPLPPVEVSYDSLRIVETIVSVQGRNIGSPLRDRPLACGRGSGTGCTVVLRTVTVDPDRFHGRAPVPGAVPDSVSVDLPPPLVGLDRGLTGLTGRPFLRVLGSWTP